MDNAYYTGATLIRAGNINGGGNTNPNQQVKYASFSANTRSAATPPLPPPPASCQLQPNLLTGLPLIRNGQQHLQPSHHVRHPGHGPQGPPPPPGVICCFQPIYYIPAPSPPTPGYNSQILLPTKQNSCAGTFLTQQSNGKGIGQPKRRNYKSLIPNHMKLKPVHSSPPPLTSQSDRDFYQNQVTFNQHRKLTGTSSYPNPISPPVKVAHQVLTRTSSNFHFFGSDDPDSVTEEKQRNDNLLNFYFEKHWRPREEEEDKAWSDPLNGQVEDELNNNSSSSWDIGQRSAPAQRGKSNGFGMIKSEKIETTAVTTPGFDRQPGAGRHSSSPPTILKQQKDLEVEAQIITLANGHRDLEIRLCYVTS